MVRGEIGFKFAILQRIAYSSTSRRCSFKELSRPGGWIDPAERLGASLVKGDLSIDTTSARSILLDTTVNVAQTRPSNFCINMSCETSSTKKSEKWLFQEYSKEVLKIQTTEEVWR